MIISKSRFHLSQTPADNLENKMAARQRPGWRLVEKSSRCNNKNPKRTFCTVLFYLAAFVNIGAMVSWMIFGLIVKLFHRRIHSEICFCICCGRNQWSVVKHRLWMIPTLLTLRWSTCLDIWRRSIVLTRTIAPKIIISLWDCTQGEAAAQSTVP